MISYSIAEESALPACKRNFAFTCFSGFNSRVFELSTIITQCSITSRNHATTQPLDRSLTYGELSADRFFGPVILVFTSPSSSSAGRRSVSN